MVEDPNVVELVDQEVEAIEVRDFEVWLNAVFIDCLESFHWLEKFWIFFFLKKYCSKSVLLENWELPEIIKRYRYPKPFYAVPFISENTI